MIKLRWMPIFVMFNISHQKSSE